MAEEVEQRLGVMLGWARRFARYESALQAAFEVRALGRTWAVASNGSGAVGVAVDAGAVPAAQATVQDVLAKILEKTPGPHRATATVEGLRAWCGDCAAEAPCSHCHGKGHDVPCRVCDGSGACTCSRCELDHDCGGCDGRGRVETCVDCGGRGAQMPAPRAGLLALGVIVDRVLLWGVLQALPADGAVTVTWTDDAWDPVVFFAPDAWAVVMPVRVADREDVVSSVPLLVAASAAARA